MTSVPNDNRDLDDITEDLTIDGADLLAALQEAHAAAPAVVPVVVPATTSDGDCDDDLTIDGNELLLEIKRSLAEEPVDAGGGEQTIERWRPAPVLPPSEAVVATRAGRASRLQLGIIAVVMAAAFGIGGYLIAGIVSEDDSETTPADAGPIDENEQEQSE